MGASIRLADGVSSSKNPKVFARYLAAPKIASSLTFFGSNDGRQISALRKALMLVGWYRRSRIGARTAFATDKVSISCSNCKTLRCFDDSLLHPEHMLLPVMQYFCFKTIPFACNRRHFVA
jgi:hypothetical protein